jgi:GNAT superfamily N-acetyltransferase
MTAAAAQQGETSPHVPYAEHVEIPPGKLAAIVTSLEMFAPPARGGERDADNLGLSHTARPELGRYRELYRRVGESWLWFSRLRMKDEHLRAILEDPLVEVHIVREGSEDAGLLELDFRDAESCELAFFGLVPRLVGKGAGRWLMNRALEIAWSRPIKRFWVHTCTLDHPHALAFYIRSGFRPFERYVEIVDDPRLDGTLPRDAAPQFPVLDERSG